jgi:YggT family protein
VITIHTDLLRIIYEILATVLSLYRWVVILAVVVNLLLAFGVLDMRNQIVRMVDDFLGRLTEPLLRPIRNALPHFGAIDISPMVLLLLIVVAEQLLAAVFRQIMALLV